MSSSSEVLTPLRDLRGDILLKGDLVAKAARRGNYAELALRRVLKVDHTGTWLTSDISLPLTKLNPRRIHEGALCVILERMPVYDGR